MIHDSSQVESGSWEQHLFLLAACFVWEVKLQEPSRGSHRYSNCPAEAFLWAALAGFAAALFLLIRLFATAYARATPFELTVQMFARVVARPAGVLEDNSKARLMTLDTLVRRCRTC